MWFFRHRNGHGSVASTAEHSSGVLFMLQVNWTVMKEWVARRVTELLGIEEEVLISMIHNHLIDQVCAGGEGGRGASSVTCVTGTLPHQVM